ncbi:MAG: 30S ribosome-binding factor RbfA [Micavibrio aeruginosavorus]|uniref:Ribosome-binding factor A n=1 Tax=Micavibrio aeruginosavorus TaxID=349221 RepID=A0A2W4ZRX1_9BACT|nr:MAG: 30S ribosome-binding factor RbfA [Micavibrio aeruginosavorus]
MKKSTASQPSQRMLRVGEQIRHVLAEVLSRGHFHNPLLMDAASSVTVTEVRVSPDLKHATAYVISLGGANMAEFLPALNEEAHAFQKEINRQTQLKFTPKLQFRGDDMFDKAQRLDSLISNIKYSDQNE